MGDEVNDVEGEFAGVGDAAGVGDETSLPQGVEGAIGVLTGEFRFRRGGLIGNEDGAGAGGIVSGRGNGLETGGDQGGRLAGVGQPRGEQRAAAATVEEVGDFARGYAGLDERGDVGEGSETEERGLVFEPAGGGSEVRPGGEGFGFGSKQTITKLFWEAEDEVAAGEAGFDQGELDGVVDKLDVFAFGRGLSEPDGAGGIESAPEFDEVAVRVDPGLVAGTGDLGFPTDAGSGAADAGPEGIADEAAE